MILKDYLGKIFPKESAKWGFVLGIDNQVSEEVKKLLEEITEEELEAAMTPSEVSRGGLERIGVYYFSLKGSLVNHIQDCVNRIIKEKR